VVQQDFLPDEAVPPTFARIIPVQPAVVHAFHRDRGGKRRRRAALMSLVEELTVLGTLCPAPVHVFCFRPVEHLFERR